jgi:hypothetical protein
VFWESCYALSQTGGPEPIGFFIGEKMNELSKEIIVMSISGVAESLNVTTQTVRNIVRKRWPGLMMNGKRTLLDEEQVSVIRAELANHHNLKSTFEVRNARTNLEIKNSIAGIVSSILSPILQQQNEFNQRLINEIKEIKNQPKQIEFTQDYFSILAYCKVKGVQIAFSQAVRYGKEAARMTNIRGLDVRKIPDERFGTVGSYPVEVLNEIFEL